MKIDIDIIHLIYTGILTITILVIIRQFLNYRVKKMVLDKDIEDKETINQILSKGIKIESNADSKQFGLLLLLGGLAVIISLSLDLDAGIILGIMMFVFGGVLFFYPKNTASGEDQ